MSTICLLGRQPAIGLAELESLYGATAVTPLDHHAALVEADVDFARLGGSIKAAQYLTTLETTAAVPCLSTSRISPRARSNSASASTDSICPS